MSKIAYNTEDAADQVGVSERSIRRAMDNGDLVPRYFGSRLLFGHQELVDWFNSLPTESGTKK